MGDEQWLLVLAFLLLESVPASIGWRLEHLSLAVGRPALALPRQTLLAHAHAHARRGLRLRGGSYQGMDDEIESLGDEPAKMYMEDLPPTAALVRHKRVNRTALDAVLYSGASGVLLSDQVDEASALAAAGIDIEEIDEQFEALLDDYNGVDFTDVRNQMLNGMPVNQPHEIVLEEEDIKRRWGTGDLTDDEQQDLVSRGKGYLIPDPDSTALPPREDMIIYLINFITQHQRECTNVECDEFCGRGEDAWEAGLCDAEYPALLEVYREIKDNCEILPTPENNPDKHWQLEGEYIKESTITNMFHAHNAPTLRCTLDDGVPHCNLCYDASIAQAQIAEGKRNRAFSQQSQPVVVPDHYPTVRLALERSYYLSFFDDNGDRGWLRNCRFWEEVYTSKLQHIYINNYGCVGIHIHTHIYTYIYK